MDRTADIKARVQNGDRIADIAADYSLSDARIRQLAGPIKKLRESPKPALAMTQINLWLPSADAAWLRSYATETGETLGSVVSEMIEDTRDVPALWDFVQWVMTHSHDPHAVHEARALANDREITCVSEE